MTTSNFQWHPIATAPRDGTRVLLLRDGDCAVAGLMTAVEDGSQSWVVWRGLNFEDHTKSMAVTFDGATDWCPLALPSAAMNRDTFWLIWFAEAGLPPEIFVSDGAEAAARARYAQVSAGYNCHLLTVAAPLAPFTMYPAVHALIKEATARADQFQWYADEHQAAGKTEKAARNQEAADGLRRAVIAALAASSITQGTTP